MPVLQEAMPRHKPYSLSHTGSIAVGNVWKGMLGRFVPSVQRALGGLVMGCVPSVRGEQPSQGG